jgi:putative membrane protein
MRFLVRVVINAIALWVAALVVDGITLGQRNNVGNTVLTALIVGAIFGIVNAIVKPILTILSIPFIIITLGLFLIVINALMLGLTSWLADVFDLSFHVADFFWDAVFGAVIVSLVSWAISVVVPEPKKG